MGHNIYSPAQGPHARGSACLGPLWRRPDGLFGAALATPLGASRSPGLALGSACLGPLRRRPGGLFGAARAAPLGASRSPGFARSFCLVMPPRRTAGVRGSSSSVPSQLAGELGATAAVPAEAQTRLDRPRPGRTRSTARCSTVHGCRRGTSVVQPCTAVAGARQRCRGTGSPGAKFPFPSQGLPFLKSRGLAGPALGPPVLDPEIF